MKHQYHKSSSFRITCLVVLALAFTSSIEAYICQPTIDSFYDRDVTVEAFPGPINAFVESIPGATKSNGAERLSQTQRALWVVQMYRKKSGTSYYEDLLDAATITYCQTYGNHDLFADPQASTAAKQPDGTCVVASGPRTPEPGQCSTIENCYWQAPVQGAMRQRKYTDSQTAAAKATVKKYVRSVAFVLIPGIVLGILNLIVMFFITICRCCCKRCGGTPAEEGYTRRQRYLPVAFFVLFSAGCFLCAAFALAGNMDVSQGTQQTFQGLEHSVLRFQRFLSRVKSPLLGVEYTTSAAVNETVKTVDGITWLGSGLQSVTDRMVAFRSMFGSRPGLSFVDGSINATLAQVGPIIENAQSSIDALTGQLVPVGAAVQGAVSSAVTLLTTVNATVAGSGNKLVVYNNKLQSYSGLQFIGVMVLFAASIVLVVLSCCGVGAGLTPWTCDNPLMGLMNITWVCGSLVVTLAFLIGSAALALGLFWYDSCQALNVVPSDFSRYVSNHEAAKMLTACWNGTSLLDTFNLTHDLAFADTLSQSLGGMGTLNVSSAFASVSMPLGTMDYGLQTFNGTSMTNAVNSKSYHPSDTGSTCALYETQFTWQTIPDPWKAAPPLHTTAPNGQPYAQQPSEDPVSYMQRVYTDSSCSAMPSLLQYWRAAYNTTTSISQMRRDLGYNSTICTPASNCPEPKFPYPTSIDSQLLIYQQNVTGVNTKLTNLTGSFVGDLIDYVDEFKCNCYCMFVKDSYNEVTNAMCGTLLGGFLQIGISLFILAFFMLFVVILTMIIKQRLLHPLQKIFVDGGPAGYGADMDGDNGASRALVV